jgi:CheY-like chemotaxis protein
MKIVRRATPPRLEFILRLDRALPMIMADPSQIEQVVMNLCLNAVQASQAAAVVEVRTQAVELDRPGADDLDISPGRYAYLQIQDRGSGMDSATLERVFEPFFTTKPTGRGMGLAATLGIVRSHHGNIRIDSTLGEGTTARVWLPLAERQPPRTASAPVRPPQVRAAPRGSETLLFIDDDAGVARTVESILTSLGYCVVVHLDPEQALAFLATNAEDINLVLLDMHLPKLSGQEVLARIKAEFPCLPVLLESGFDLHDRLDALIQQGAAGFLQKPFSLMDLAVAVRGTLDKAASLNQPSSG